MKFWTKEQYLAFSEEVMDKPASFYAFEILYWCGLRVGELLALEPNDIDLGKCLIHVTKSYQRIRRRDVITSPKTPKSKRDVVMPEFLGGRTRRFPRPSRRSGAPAASSASPKATCTTR